MNPDPSSTPFGPAGRPVDPSQFKKAQEKKSEESDPNLEKDGALLVVSKELPKVDDLELLEEEPIDSSQITIGELVEELNDQESSLLLKTAFTLMKATSEQLLPAAETVANQLSEEES